jgi:hypothetical protein
MRKIAFLLVLLAAGALMSESASAGGRVVVGVGFGFPVWGWGAPWYYAPPPYYYAPPQVVYSSPPVYVERQSVERQSVASDRAQDWWYYCEQSKGYYPYVKTCPSGWQKVSPVPPPG